jgi:hypothetical protein
MCEDGVPQEGHGAIGDVVRRVSVISKATSTSSTWTSGRSGKMSIEGLWVLKNGKEKEKMFNFLVYHILDQRACVRTIKWRDILSHLFGAVQK